MAATVSTFDRLHIGAVKRLIWPVEPAASVPFIPRVGSRKLRRQVRPLDGFFETFGLLLTATPSSSYGAICRVKKLLAMPRSVTTICKSPLGKPSGSLTIT